MRAGNVSLPAFMAAAAGLFAGFGQSAGTPRLLNGSGSASTTKPRGGIPFGRSAAKRGNHRYCKAWPDPRKRAPGGPDALRARPFCHDRIGNPYPIKRAAKGLFHDTHDARGRNKRRNQAEREASARAIRAAHARCRLPCKGTLQNRIERLRLIARRAW